MHGPRRRQGAPRARTTAGKPGTRGTGREACWLEGDADGPVSRRHASRLGPAAPPARYRPAQPEQRRPRDLVPHDSLATSLAPHRAAQQPRLPSAAARRRARRRLGPPTLQRRTPLSQELASRFLMPLRHLRTWHDKLLSSTSDAAPGAAPYASRACQGRHRRPAGPSTCIACRPEHLYRLPARLPLLARWRPAGPSSAAAAARAHTCSAATTRRIPSSSAAAAARSRSIRSARAAAAASACAVSQGSRRGKDVMRTGQPLRLCSVSPASGQATATGRRRDADGHVPASRRAPATQTCPVSQASASAARRRSSAWRAATRKVTACATWGTPAGTRRLVLDDAANGPPRQACHGPAATRPAGARDRGPRGRRAWEPRRRRRRSRFPSFGDRGSRAACCRGPGRVAARGPYNPAPPHSPLAPLQPSSGCSLPTRPAAASLASRQPRGGGLAWAAASRA